MFSKVLDCPECKHRFNYEHEGTDFPERITCPECHNSSKFSDFSALTFCPQCRAKLKIPLDILFDGDLSCPSCGTMLNATGSFIDETSASTLGGSNAGSAVDRRQMYKRMLQDGTIFDKYKIIRLLGKGGMAEVYLAEHLLLKQMCAVKLMRASSGDDSEMAVKRFLREAKLSHQFNHPNIVKVFDVGSDFQTGYLFIAMEYVEGKTLHDLAKERPFTEDELVKVLVSMANALNALAEVRVVHRDIKPSNIMLTNDGVYKLMDLGIAKSDSNSHMAGDMTLTMEQSTIGTPNYASPEQCRSAHNVDLRSDIYSLGATLYHLASGKLPFSGTTAVETILNVMQTEAIPIKSHRPDLSDRMIGLIEQMMRKNPEERPQLPDALLAAIYSAKANKFMTFIHKTGALITDIFSKSSTQKAAKKRSLPAKIFRWAVAAGLLFIILINIRHINNYARNTDNIREIFGIKDNKTSKGQKRKPVDILANCHPMLPFPDEYGEFNKYIGHKVLNKYSLPKIKFTSDDKEKLILLYDFAGHKNEANPQEDGLVNLADSKMDIVIPSGIMVNDFTISLDFCSGKGGNTILFNIGTYLKVLIYKGKLTVIAKGNHYIVSNIVVPDDTWANATLIYEKDKRKLILLSGDRFAGSYLLPEEFSWNRLALGDKSYFYAGGSDWLIGKVDTIKIYNCARKILLPENKDEIPRDYIVAGSRETVAGFKPEIAPQQKVEEAVDNNAKAENKSSENAPASTPDNAAADAKETAEKASSTAAPAADAEAKADAANSNLSIGDIPQIPELEQNRMIANRLEWCKKRLNMLKNTEKDFLFKKEMIEFVQKQVDELTRQQEIALKVKQNFSVTSKRNSDTDKFISIAQKYLKEKRKTGKTREDEYKKDLIEKIESGNSINVNAEFSVSDSGEKKTIADFVFFDIFALDRKQKIEFLCNRLVDVNKMNRLMNSYPMSDLFFFGKDNIDNIVMHFLDREPSNSYYSSQIGRIYRIADARKLLVLAPKLNGAYSPKGYNLMHYAVLADDPEFAAELIYAGFFDFEGGKVTPWRLALRCGSVKMVEFFKKIGLNKNETQQDLLQFELWNAVAANDLQTVEKCLQKGADLKMKNGRDLDLLQYACYEGKEDVVKLLVKHKTAFDYSADREYSIVHPAKIAAVQYKAAALEVLYNANMNPFKIESPSQSRSPAVQYSRTVGRIIYMMFNRYFISLRSDTAVEPNLEEKLIDTLKVIVKYSDRRMHRLIISGGISQLWRYGRLAPGKGESEKIAEYLLSIDPSYRVPEQYISRTDGKLKELLVAHNKKASAAQSSNRRTDVQTNVSRQVMNNPNRFKLLRWGTDVNRVNNKYTGPIRVKVGTTVYVKVEFNKPSLKKGKKFYLSQLNTEPRVTSKNTTNNLQQSGGKLVTTQMLTGTKPTQCDRLVMQIRFLDDNNNATSSIDSAIPFKVEWY